MCGLCGVFGTGNLTGFHTNGFRMLMQLGVVRGEDSTGVAIRTTNYGGREGTIQLYKSEGMPHNLYAKFSEQFSPLDGKLVYAPGSRNYRFAMGHLRSKTRGAVNVDNAHPFMFGNIVGAHNGTLKPDFSKLPKPPGKGDTDSERVFYALSEGYTLDQVFETTEGAAALSWYDTETGSYNLYRNEERPLYYTQQGQFVFYASEAWMLQAALKSTKNQEFLGKDAIKLLPTGKIHTWNLKATTLGQPVITDVEHTGVPARVTTTTTTTTTVYPRRTENLPSYKEVSTGGASTFLGGGWLDRTFINKAAFDAATSFGCACCGSDLTYDDQVNKKVKWLQTDTPLCTACATKWTEGKTA